MAWHSAGTYRIGDGRGGAGDGTQRFAPLNSWPDNVSLDKARRLLWPIKQKYGKKISWADLMILAGNVALESMGFKTFGFAGGREDVWEPDQDVYWGAEHTWLGGDVAMPRLSWSDAAASPSPTIPPTAISHPQTRKPPRRRADGPDLRQSRRPRRQPRSPSAPRRDIRETFGRMAMNDEETVALIAGGHTFGKTHGAGDDRQCRPRARSRRPSSTQGLGWKNNYAHRQRRRHHHQRPGRHLDHHPDQMGQQLLRKPLRLRVGTDQEPRRRTAVEAQRQRRRRHGPRRTSIRPRSIAPDRCSPPTSRCASTRPTKKSPAASSQHPDQFADAFARAWFKLTHRDMGPRARYLGPEVPAEELIWQDPIPAVDHQLIDDDDIAALKAKILASGLSIPRTGFHRLGLGLHLPRLRQARRRQRCPHPPRPAKGLARQPTRPTGKVLTALEGIQSEFNAPNQAARKSRWPT